MLPMRVGQIQGRCLFSLFLLMLSGAWINLVQAQSGIVSPISGDVLSGVVEVVGTAVHPNYLRYELAFLQEVRPEAGWIVFAEGTSPVNEGVLAVWDTAVGWNVGAPVFPDGRYQLRLRVVKTDYNYDEYFVTDITISNSGPTPTPTPDETAVAVTATAAALQSSQPTAASGGSFQQPTPLPSLTPFPTLTPLPTAVSRATPAQPDTTAETDGGVIGQIEAVDTRRFAEAFWGGVKLTAALFALLAAYLFLRAGGRRVWRIFWRKRL
ncbi:MAG: hypothetical protein GY796_00790 [Chloroflexi bacterium]|nr:hypothetical protein [Chloroflexota bacterium]